MIRAVLAVALASAILATSLPAIDGASVDRSERQVRSELTDLRERVARLVATDDAVRAGPGPRRLVTLDLPVSDWTTAGVAAVRIERAPDGSGTVLTWSVEGGQRHRRRFPTLTLVPPDEAPLVLSGGGRRRLVVRLDGSPPNATVSIRRFKSEHATTPPHASLAVDRQRGPGLSL